MRGRAADHPADLAVRRGGRAPDPRDRRSPGLRSALDEVHAAACRQHLDRAAIEQLRDGRFDAAVIFTVFSQSPLPAALLCYLADIPLRLAHCHENPYQLLSTGSPIPSRATEIRHEVRRQLDLVATVGARIEDERLSLRVPDAAQADGATAACGSVASMLTAPGACCTPARPPRRGAIRLSCTPRSRGGS